MISETINESDFSSESHVKVYSNGQKVSCLTITKIAIWNTGTKTLCPSDIATNVPICIKTAKDGIKILEVQKVYSEEKNNIRNIRISKNNKSITFDFEFLANKDGIVLKVIHTGKKSDLIVQGALLNGRNIEKVYPETRNWHFISLYVGVAAINIILIAVILLNSHLYISIIALLIGYITLILILTIKAFKNRVPRDLSHWLFEEEQQETKFYIFLEKLLRQ